MKRPTSPRLDVPTNTILPSIPELNSSGAQSPPGQAQTYTRHADSQQASLINSTPQQTTEKRAREIDAIYTDGQASTKRIRKDLLGGSVSPRQRIQMNPVDAPGTPLGSSVPSASNHHVNAEEPPIDNATLPRNPRQIFFRSDFLRSRLLPYLGQADYFQNAIANNINVLKEVSKMPFTDAHEILHADGIAAKAFAKVLEPDMDFRCRMRLTPSLPNHPQKEALFAQLLAELRERNAGSPYTTMGSEQMAAFSEGIDCMREVVVGWKLVPGRAKPQHVQPLLGIFKEYGDRAKALPQSNQHRGPLLSAMSNLATALCEAFANGKLDTGIDWRPVVQAVNGHHSRTKEAETRIKIMRGITDWQSQGENFSRFIVVNGDTRLVQAYHFMRYMLATTRLTGNHCSDLLQDVSAALSSQTSEQSGFERHAPVLQAGLEEHVYPLVRTLIDGMSELTPDCKIALKNLATRSSIDGRWEMDIRTLIPQLHRVPSTIRSEVLTSLSTALIGDHGTFAQFGPTIIALTPYIGSMPDWNRGMILSELSDALAHSRATFDQLDPTLNALKPYIPSMADEDRGGALWDLSDALLMGNGTIEQLGPFISDLLSYISTMQDEDRGGAMGEIAAAIANCRCSFEQAGAALAAFTPYLISLPDDDRGSVLGSVACMLSDRHTSFDRLEPFLSGLTPHIDSMPDNCRGIAMAELSAALANQSASFAQLAPLFAALIPHVPAMGIPERERARDFLYTASENGHISEAEFLPLMENL